MTSTGYGLSTRLQSYRLTPIPDGQGANGQDQVRVMVEYRKGRKSALKDEVLFSKLNCCGWGVYGLPEGIVREALTIGKGEKVGLKPCAQSVARRTHPRTGEFCGVGFWCFGLRQARVVSASFRKEIEKQLDAHS